MIFYSLPCRLYVPFFLPSLVLLTVFLRPASRAAKPSIENAAGALAGRTEKAPQHILTLTQAIGSHTRDHSHVISAVFVNGNP